MALSRPPWARELKHIKEAINTLLVSRAPRGRVN